MAITAGDVSVAANGYIRWEASGAGDGPYTVLELHRFLQDLADDQSATGDDILDITSSTPSERSTDNIITLNGTYNIDAEMAQHLYNGSITQDGGDEIYAGLVVVGSVNLSTTLMVIQDNALYDDGVHTPSNPFWGSGLNSDAAANILMRCMIKVKTGGSEIDGQRLRIQAREYGDTYAEFSVTMGLGNSTAAIFTGDDINNNTAVGTVAGWTTITTSNDGYYGIDLNNGNGTKYYLDEWDRDSYTINQLYERGKWLQRRGATATDIHGIDGELYRGITHQFNFDGADGVGGFTQDEILSWGTGATAGTGLLLAATNLAGVSGTMWIQLLTGVICTDGLEITGLTSSETCDVNGSATSRTVSPCFFGSSTGSAIIGAFGVGIEAADLTNSDKLTALDNSLQVPPNNVTFTVSGLVSGEDYVLVGPKAAGNDFDFDQMSLNTTLNGGSETTIDVGTGNIPADTPQTGTLRVTLDDGRIRRIAYTSHDGDDGFTVASSDWTDPDDATAGNDVMLSYIDKLATGTSENFTVVYDNDRDLFVRVRDGGASPIKTFETPATLGIGGGSASAIRTSDA